MRINLGDWISFIGIGGLVGAGIISIVSGESWVIGFALIMGGFVSLGAKHPSFHKVKYQ